jgi:hypothetical protein
MGGWGGGGRGVPRVVEGCHPNVPPALLHHHHRQPLAEAAGTAVGRHIHQGTLDDETHQAAMLGSAGQLQAADLADHVLLGDEAVAMAYRQGRRQSTNIPSRAEPKTKPTRRALSKDRKEWKRGNPGTPPSGWP